MFSCFSLPPSSSSPEDGFLSFSEKREKRKTAFRAGSPFSVFLLGKLFFSSLLRNASSCHPLRREKEKKEIAMLSESVVRREEEPPSFFLFPLEGRSRHFSQKRKRKKRREHRNPSSRRKTFPVGGREKKKKAKERNPPVCRAPVLGKRAKRKGGSLHSLERFFPLAKRGTPPDAESGREKKGNLLQRTEGESPLAFLSEKKGKEEGSVFALSSFFRHSSTSLPPLLFSCVPSSALF